MRIKRFISRIIMALLIMTATTTLLHNFDKQIYVEAAAVGLTKAEITLYVGKTQTLKMKGVSDTVTWSSSDKSIATVSKNGKVTAKKKGTAVVTAKVTGKKYQCKVTVDQITLNYKEISIEPEDQMSLSMVNSKKRTVFSSSEVTWSSSNSSVASVSKKGKVTAKSLGEATITGTSADGTKASCKVYVTGIKFLNIPEYLKVGDTVNIDYTYVAPSGQKDDLVWKIEHYEDEDDTQLYNFNKKTMSLTGLKESAIFIEARGKRNADLVAFQRLDIVNEIPLTIEELEYIAANTKPSLKTPDGFIIKDDSSVTLFDMPVFYLLYENKKTWNVFYYTLDGTTPTQNSTRFRSQILVEQDCTLKMIGVSDDIVSQVLTIDIKLNCGNHIEWGTGYRVDIQIIMYAIKNNVTDLSLLNEIELELYHKTKEIIKEIIKPGMTDYDKIKAIHDYICINTTYGYSANNQDAYGALILKECVCAGYASAFRLLTGLCDIKSIIIHGDLIEPYDHAWNMVLLDGEWYHVDCTHDDLNNDEEQVQYRFFLVNDAYFAWKYDGTISYNRNWVKEVQRDPFTEKSYTYPVATSTKYQPAVDFIAYYNMF